MQKHQQPGRLHRFTQGAGVSQGPGEGIEGGVVAERKAVIAGQNVEMQDGVELVVAGQLRLDNLGLRKQRGRLAQDVQRGLRVVGALGGEAQIGHGRGEIGGLGQRPAGVRLAPGRVGEAVDGGQARPGPGAFTPVVGQGQLGQHRLGVVPLAHQVGVDEVAVGLGLAIEVDRRLAEHVVHVAGLADHPLAGGGSGAHGQRQAARLAVLGRDPDQFAADAGLVAQPGAQEAFQFADGDAGAGNLHLGVAGPGGGVAGRAAHALGLAVEGGQVVEQLGGQHLAGNALGGQVGRGGKGLDDQPVVVGGVPDHEPQRRGRRDARQAGQALEDHPHPLRGDLHQDQAVVVDQQGAGRTVGRRSGALRLERDLHGIKGGGQVGGRGRRLTGHQRPPRGNTAYNENKAQPPETPSL